jgi:xanthine dehydrogenase accessory factor
LTEHTTDGWRLHETPFPFSGFRVVVRGGGDLGSGVAYRLWHCGFPVLITELAWPLLIRRTVSFGSAATEGSITVEGITARRVDDIREALQAHADGDIPVLIDPEGTICSAYAPSIMVDARMLKRAPGRHPFLTPLTIGLGPGYSAPNNCDAVIETKRGHTLGRVIREGEALPDTREPGTVLGRGADRVLRAPVDGAVTGLASIGAIVEQGQVIAKVDEHPVATPFAGALRGLVYDGLIVQAGAKIADIDPRGEPAYCFTISDKALAIGGGVLEAIFSTPVFREHLKGTS